MEYLKDSTQYGSLSYVVKIVLTMFDEQADVECGFSVNTNLIVENVSDESLTAQRFVQDHMKCKEDNPHNMPILKELLQSVKRSNVSYKEALETKNKSQQKLEIEIDEEFIQLKKRSPP